MEGGGQGCLSQVALDQLLVLLAPLRCSRCDGIMWEQHTNLPILLLLTAGAVASHSCQYLVPKRLRGAPACFPGSPFQYSQQTAAQPGGSTRSHHGEHRRARHTASSENTLTRVLPALSRREWIWVRKLKARCVKLRERLGALCQRQTLQPA